MTIDSHHRVVLIRVARKFTPGDGDEQVYAAARHWWRVGPQRRDGGPASPEFALAVFRGHVVGAFTIDGWEPGPGGRWGFHGRVSDELTHRYLGADVREYFPRGAANPLKYVNCEDQARK